MLRDGGGSQGHPRIEVSYPGKRRRAEMLGTPRDSAGSLRRSHNIRFAGDLLKTSFPRWMWDYISTVARGKYPFPRLDLDDPQAGIYRMPNQVSIGMAGDWASGTSSAYRVRDEMLKLRPEITIHLGDVYFTGKQEEFDEYFLGPDDWPRGSLEQTGEITALPSYALNGNHEMYSGGRAYFESIRRAFGQQTSFFCIENAHWRVVGLDTGYFAKLFPLFELLPWWIHLHPHNVEWLQRNVLSADDQRPILLLSHHQLFSAFESEYTRLADGLGRDPRYLLWFWGHEHRLALYGQYHRNPQSPRVRARCIGHGGMPTEDIHLPVRRDRNLVAHDRRIAGQVNGTQVGYNGFAFLEFLGRDLKVSYRDDTGRVLLREEWSTAEGGARGQISEVAVDQLTLEQEIEALVT